MENPYIVGPTVSGANLFGRDRELQFVLDALEAHDKTPILLHGQRRVGKSSILAHLQAEIFAKRDIISVYIDLQHIAPRGRPDAQFDQILSEFVEIFQGELDFTGPPRTNSVSWETYFTTEFIPSVFQTVMKKSLVVLVDEFDSLPDFEKSSSTLGQESAAHQLMTLFNDLSAREDLDISFVVVVGRQFDHLPRNIRALMNRLRAQLIWLLSEENTQELITRPIEGHTISYQSEAVDRIYELTHGHAYFTQAICSEVFEDLVNSGSTTVTPADVEAVIKKVFIAANTGFAWLWADLSATRKLILAAVAEFDTQRKPVAIEDIDEVLRQHNLRLQNLNLLDELNYLVQHKTLRQIDSTGTPSRYQVAIELVRLWVKERNPISDLTHRITKLVPEADTAYQRATTLYLETDDLEKARQELENAVRQNPYHYDAQIALGDVLQGIGDHQEAIKAYQAAYALHPVQARDSLIAALLTHGANLEGQKLHTEASNIYREVLSLDPAEPTVTRKIGEWFEKGQQAYEQKAWSEAVAYLQRVVDTKSDYQQDQASQLLEKARIATLSAGTEAGEGSAIRTEVTETPEKEPRRSSVGFPLPLWLIFGIGGFTALLFLAGFLLVFGDGSSFVAFIGLYTPTPTNTPTPHPPPTQTPIIIVVTSTPTAIPTSTPTPLPTDTPVPTNQPSPTPTDTPSPTRTPTNTATATHTPTQPPGSPTYTPTPFIIEVTATPLPLDLPAGRAFDIALLNESDGQRVIALMAGRGIYQTEDGGYRWEPLWESAEDASIDADRLYDLAVAPSDPKSIYIAGQSLVMNSHDGGMSWEVSRGRLTTPGYLPAQAQVYSLAVGYQDPMLVYAATEKGVFRSHDGGWTWQALDKDIDGNFINDPIYAVAIDPTSSDEVVHAAGSGDRILNMTDSDAVRWRISICRPCRSAIYALAFGPDGTAFAGSEEGIIARKDRNRQDWNLNYESISPGRAVNLVISNLTIDPDDPAVIYAGTGWRNNSDALGILRSLNGGASWQQLNDGLLPHENPAPYVQGVAAARDGRLYIATQDGVYQLDNVGTWEEE